MTFKDRVLKVKQVLPLNGDWLWPTPTLAPTGQHVEDFAETYSTPEKVLEVIPKPMSGDIADVVMSEANRIAHGASARADTVRDKAKVLLGTSSFVGAVVAGILSLAFQHMKLVPTWINIPFTILFTLMLIQFGFSLILSMRAMTREKLLEMTPPQLGCIINEAGELEEFKRRLAAIRFALANKNSISATEKVNDLILGQTGFGFGLFYALILFLLFAIAFVTSESKFSDFKSDVVETQTIRSELLSITGALQEHLNQLQNTNSAQNLSIRNDIERLTSRIDDLIKRLEMTPKKSPPPKVKPEQRKVLPSKGAQ